MSTSDPISRLRAALDGRYRIERELGEGGMATVYLARDERHRRNVALKVLKPELAAALGHERFLKEIEVTANLNHPHILPLHDSGEASGFLYYVMPYVEGESLRDRLDRDRELPVEESLRIAKAVATALDYAHRQGIVHRDIKPRNILLQDGQPLIADFGIALAITAAAGPRLTATGLSIGTPQYMSPEQASADRPVDGRTDVYALACVLFEMLAGEPPFTGSNAGALLARKLTDTAPDVSTVRESVPQPVADAVRRGLSRTPADRFQSAADFVRALGESDPVTRLSRPPVATPAPGLPAASPGPLVLAFVTLVLGVLGGVLGGRLLTNTPPTPRMTLAVPLSGRDVAGGNWRALTISSDGSRLALLLADSVDRRLYLKEMEDFPSAVEGSEGAMSPAFSPDGRFLAYFTREGIWRLDVESGSQVRIGESYGIIMGATWTDDDRLLFTPGYRGGLSAIPVDGGPVTELTQLEVGESSHRYATAIPGTSLVLVDVRGRSVAENIWLLDVESGERRPLTAGIYPRYVDGMLFFARDRTLFGQRLDVGAGALIGNAVPVLQDVGGDYAISGTGTLVHVRSSGWPSMRYLASIDASGSRSLITPEPAAFRTPRVSPDGQRVAVGVGQEVRIYNLVTGALEVVDTSSSLQVLWSTDPDSSALVYSSGSSILRNDLVTGERVELVAEDTARAFTSPSPLAWDGEDLIVRAIGVTNGTEGDLWRLRGDGSREALRVNTDVALAADVSVGGRFAYAEGPMAEDMRIHLSTSTESRASVAVSGVGAVGSRWAPDGGAIYFVERSELVRVPVDADGNSVSEARTTVFDFGRRANVIVPPFDVHPDGEHFVVTIPIPTPPTEVLVETGWLASVRELIR